MLSRRAFLHQGSLVLASLTTLGAHAAPSRTGPLNLPIGIQLWAVKDDVAKDLPAALKAVAAIGYKEVELFGKPTLPPEKLKTVLSDLGLKAPSMHVGMSDVGTDLQQRVDFAKGVGAEYLVVSFPWTADSRFKDGGQLASGITLDDWKWNADQLNRMGEVTKKAGIKAGYHNHNMEFRSYDGVTGYDELLRRTDPALVTMQLDIGWVVTAGADPLTYLTKHANRVSMLHVKDVRKGFKKAVDHMDSQTVEIGSGQVDWPRLFAAMDRKQIKHYFVEQENFERAPLEAAKLSFNYLSTLKV